jgi:hypothetical protein
MLCHIEKYIILCQCRGIDYRVIYIICTRELSTGYNQQVAELNPVYYTYI